MKHLLACFFLVLTACGGAGGGSSGGASPTGGTAASGSSGGGAGAGGGGPVLHTYTIEVTCQGNDFTFAPGLLGPNGHDNSPGPQTLTSAGQVLTYSLIDTTADVAITGISATNGGFYSSVVVYKDGVQVATGNVGVGVTIDFGLAPYNLN